MTITRSPCQPPVVEITHWRINLVTYPTRDCAFGFSISRATITINILRRRFELRWLSL